MDIETSNSRRNFIRNVTLTSLVAVSLPEMLVTARPASHNQSKQNKDGLVFLFQGDSITEGNRGRKDNPNHRMGHGYAYSIASRLGADYPEKKFDFHNRGIAGNKVTDMASRWQQDTLRLNPDVLSILIGVNDTGSIIHQRDQVTADKYEEVYKTLLDQTCEKFPGILFVLCEPFILPVGEVKKNLDFWHDDLTKRRGIVKRLAIEYNAVFVEFQGVLDKACKRASADYWTWDGIHPTAAAHELLTREWIKQVSKRLSFF
jgi:lysophospholipase L1-like esterase